MGVRRGVACFALAALVFGACGSNATGEPQTWKIDCVAVLGTPPPSAQMPLSAAPFSGAPRDKRIGDLTDDELGKLCDFDTCMTTNGYRHDCCVDRYCTPPDESFGAFRLETVPLLAGAMSTCYSTSYEQATNGSRESDESVYRRYFGACHVGQWEDCTRETAVDPLGATGQGIDCAERNAQCATGQNSEGGAERE